MTTDRINAVALLESADFDAQIAHEIAQDVMDGWEADAIGKLVDELDIGEEKAKAVYDHLRSVLPGDDLALEEIGVADAIHLTTAQMCGPGNPFVLRPVYLARRGFRVFVTLPTQSPAGVKTFASSGGTFDPGDIHQLWRTAVKPKTRKSNSGKPPMKKHIVLAVALIASSLTPDPASAGSDRQERPRRVDMDGERVVKPTVCFAGRFATWAGGEFGHCRSPGPPPAPHSL